MKAFEPEYMTAYDSIKRKVTASKLALLSSFSSPKTPDNRTTSSAPAFVRRQRSTPGANKSGHGLIDIESLRLGVKVVIEAARKLIVSGKNRFDSASN